MADLDGDAAEDVFLHNPTTGVWLEMTSDGAGGQTWSLGWNLYPADLNGDGRADFLLYGPATGAVYQLRNLTLGTFEATYGTWAPALTIVTRPPMR